MTAFCNIFYMSKKKKNAATTNSTKNSIGYISVNIDSMIVVKNIAVAIRIDFPVEYKSKYLMKRAITAITNMLPKTTINIFTFKSKSMLYNIKRLND